MIAARTLNTLATLRMVWLQISALIAVAFTATLRAPTPAGTVPATRPGAESRITDGSSRSFVLFVFDRAMRRPGFARGLDFANADRIALRYVAARGLSQWR